MLVIAIAVSVGIFFLKPKQPSTVTSTGKTETFLQNKAPENQKQAPPLQDSVEQPNLHRPEATKSNQNQLESLPTENRFLVDRQSIVNPGVTSKILSSSTFPEVVDAFREEQSLNPLSREFTDTYRELFEALRDEIETGAFELGELVCGMQICIGSITTFDEGATWRELVINHLGGPDQSQFGSMTSVPLQLAEGETEQRFLFTMDPNANIMQAEFGHGDAIEWLGSYDGDEEVATGEVTDDEVEPAADG